MLRFTNISKYPDAQVQAALGYIPQFLDTADPRPAKEQIHEAYIHGGGWDHFEGFKFDPATKRITYPGDPPYDAIASAKLREETIILYPHAWVMILQPNNSFEIWRLD